MGRAPRDVFVPNGDSRRETAIILVGTADEYNVDQRSIMATKGGFYITSELADFVYDEPEPEPVKKAGTTKKTSGNRAAKKNSEEE